MKNASKARSSARQRTTLICHLGVAVVLASALWLWNARSANEPRDTTQTSGALGVTYGTPQVSIERRNVPGAYLRVLNNGDTAITHQLTRDVPVERSAHAALSEDRTTGTLTRTHTTEVVATIFDATKCDETELAEISGKLEDDYLIPQGKHGLEGFPCVRLKEVRSYGIQH